VTSLLTSTSTIPSLTPPYTAWTLAAPKNVPCRKFPGLEGEDSQTLEQARLSLKKYKWVADATRSSGWGFWKSAARSWSATFCRAIPLDKQMTLFKKRWSTQGRTDNSKKKIRRQFSARYGEWLRLAWQFGSSHNGTNKKQWTSQRSGRE
jgi:hypothetical protein